MGLRGGWSLIRATAVVRTTGPLDRRDILRRCGAALAAEPVDVLEGPSPVYSELDLFSVVAVGEEAFGVHYDMLGPRPEQGLLVVTLTGLPTGPPGVGHCPPLEDSEAARALRAAVARALDAAFGSAATRWCTPDELRGLLVALLDGAGPG